MEWEQLVEALQGLVTSAAEVNTPKADNEGEAEGAAAPAAPQAEQSGVGVVSQLNRKLLEVHSKLKAFDDEVGFGHGDQSQQQTHAGVTRQTVEQLVFACRDVLRMREQLSEHAPGHASLGHSHALAAQLLAELCKTDLGRSVCLEHKIIDTLESVLGQQVGEDEEKKDESQCEDQEKAAQLKAINKGLLETAVQICRILGNLCFNCPEGRQQVLDTQCLQHIHHIAKDRERFKREDPGQRFPVILPGFLLNFCNETSDSIELAGREVGMIDVVAQNVLSTQTNDAVFNSSLNFLVTIAEDEMGHEILRKSSLFPKALNHVLEYTTSPEVTETALELIRSIAEDPDLTLALAGSALCSTLVTHIEGRWKSKDFDEHRSDACDLLVLILSHDASMKYIYTSNNGKFLETFLDWLKKDDMQLKVAASLAIGNFACNEEHCAQLMAGKVSLTLIDILKAHQNPNSDLKLQHAVLGCVRNLAVAPNARKQLIEQGLLDPCLRLIEKLSLLSSQPVIFKLLATLRLVIDDSTAASQTIGRSRSILAIIVEWGNAEAQGVRAEVARLLAALIKHCRSAEVLESVVACGGLPHVTAMLMSSHVRMLNEALVALAVLAASIASEDVVHRQLHTDLVINALKNCLRHEEHPLEVKANALTLTQQLLRSKTDEFKAMLADMQFVECMSECSPQIQDLDQYKRIMEVLSTK